MLTTFDIFAGGLTIGGYSMNKEALKWFAEVKEPEFMRRYIGDYEQLLADMSSEDESVKQRAQSIWDVCKLPCAIYIWCYYTNENQEKQSGSGNVKMSNENSTVQDSSGKIVRNWNWMVNLTRGGETKLKAYGINAGRFSYNSTWI